MDVRDVTGGRRRRRRPLRRPSTSPIGSLNADWTYDINLDGSIRLARAARDAGVGRFVFASSCSMYGASGTDAALDESAPLNPLTAYAESKVAAEREILELSREGFSVVSMRNATVYGVSPRLRLDIVLNNLAGSAVTSGALSRLLSDGTAWRPMSSCPRSSARGGGDSGCSVGPDLGRGDQYRLRRAELRRDRARGCTRRRHVMPRRVRGRIVARSSVVQGRLLEVR